MLLVDVLDVELEWLYVVGMCGVCFMMLVGGIV